MDLASGAVLDTSDERTSRVPLRLFNRGQPDRYVPPGPYRSRCASQSVIIATASACIITGGGSFA